MRCTEFQAAIRETGRYETGLTAPAPDRPCLWRWDAAYYARLLAIVLRGYGLVRRKAFDNAAWARQSFRTLQLVERSGGRVTVQCDAPGRQRSEPVVYVANHMSLLETFLLPCVLLAFGPVTTVVKRSLLRYPFFGTVLRATRPIAVGRSRAREDLKTVMHEGREVLAGGRSVLVFPQATRSPVFDPRAFNTMGARLAVAAAVPLVPVALRTDFHGIGRPLKDVGRIDRRRPVCVRVGPPRAATRQALRRVHGETAAFLSDSLAAWGVPAADGNAAAG